MQKYKNKTKWTDKYVSKKTISTAIQDYLERNGYMVNRKRGIELDFNGCWTRVEKV